MIHEVDRVRIFNVTCSAFIYCHCCEAGETMSLWNWAANGYTAHPPDDTLNRMEWYWQGKNLSTWRKTCHSALSISSLTWTTMSANPDLRGEKPVTNLLNYAMWGLWVALMMEAASTSETLVNFYQTTRCDNPEDSHLHTTRIHGATTQKTAIFILPEYTVRQPRRQPSSYYQTTRCDNPEDSHLHTTRIQGATTQTTIIFIEISFSPKHTRLNMTFTEIHQEEKFTTDPACSSKEEI
jgi:hypothetical protein